VIVVFYSTNRYAGCVLLYVLSFILAVIYYTTHCAAVFNTTTLYAGCVLLYVLSFILAVIYYTTHCAAVFNTTLPTVLLCSTPQPSMLVVSYSAALYTDCDLLHYPLGGLCFPSLPTKLAVFYFTTY
jgi:predicted neutral ceramidase superfamily lipid hydrolase